MPAKTVTNPAAAAIAAMNKVAPGADKEYRDKPAESKGGMLPAGLRGIAELTGFKFDVKAEGFNKGKAFVAFRGAVKKCVDAQGNDYRGSLFYHEVTFADGRGFGDKPGKKAKAKVDEAMNTMKLLGADLSDSVAKDWTRIMAAVIDERVHFHFRTWAMEPTPAQPNPRVNAEVIRVAEDFQDDEAGEEVVDNTEVEVVAEEEEVVEEAGEEVVEEEVTESEEGVDYVALGELADSTNKKRAKEAKEAAATLQTAAEEVGLDFEALGSWSEVAEALASAGGETADEGEAEEEPEAEPEAEAEPEQVTPVKGDVVEYKPVDPKTKKPFKKAVQCEVIKVYGPKRKVDLKNLENGKTLYKDVSWDNLSL